MKRITVMGLIVCLILVFVLTGCGGKSKIVFFSDRGGNIEAYIMNIDGSEQTLLTDDVAEDNDLSISDDGSKIKITGDFDGVPSMSAHNSKMVFDSNRDGNREIYVYNWDDEIQLTNNEAIDKDPSISPDGSKIAFVSNRDGNSEIYIMSADGSEQTRLTDNEAFDGCPSISPDGSKIAFESDRDGNNEVYIMNIDGSDQTNLTNNEAFDTSPSCSRKK